MEGRTDNVIVTGGVSVPLDRVEDAVRGIAGLEAAVVVGVPHAELRQTSVIVAGRDVAPTAIEVDGGADHLARARAAVAAEVGDHARPTHLFVLDSLPTVASGAPDRFYISQLVAGTFG